MIVFNEGNRGREDLFIGTLGNPFEIPVVGLGFADGASQVAQLQAGDTVTMHVATETEIDPTRTTRNIIADSPTGNANHVVVVGAHLDSVIAEELNLLGPSTTSRPSATTTSARSATPPPTPP